MAWIDQSKLAGKIRDRPISGELKALLERAGRAAQIDSIHITSGGQPGYSGNSTGSTRHDGGRAADLYLVKDDKVLAFTNSSAPVPVKKFITACAGHGALGIGAGVDYMGKEIIHVGFGLTPSDRREIVWGAKGQAARAPKWLRTAAEQGWNNPPSWIFDGGRVSTPE